MRKNGVTVLQGLWIEDVTSTTETGLLEVEIFQSTLEHIQFGFKIGKLWEVVKRTAK